MLPFKNFYSKRCHINNLKNKIKEDGRYEILVENYFEWKIEEWNKCKKEACYSQTNLIGDYSWRIELMPSNENDDSIFSIYINSLNENDSIHANYVLSLCNYDNYSIHKIIESKEIKCFDRFNNKYGLEHYKINNTLDNNKPLIENDKIIIGVYLRIYKLYSNGNIVDKYLNKLLYACMNNDNHKVESLIKQGTEENNNIVNINKEADDGAIPLIIACKNKNTEIVKILINNGADVNIKNKNNETPLTIACDNGSQSIVDLLVENGADTNKIGLNGSTPLTIACKKENESLIHNLIKYDADINMKDNNNYTPLAVACATENDSIIKLLIDFGVYLNVKVIDHQMPLSILYRKNNSSLIKSYFNPDQATIINSFLINHFCTLYINQFKVKGCFIKIFIKSLNKDIYGVLSLNHALPLNYFNINDNANTSYKIMVKWFEKTYSINVSNFIFTSELLGVIFIELDEKIVKEVQPYFLSISNNENEIKDIIYSLQFSMNQETQRNNLNEAIILLLNKYKNNLPMSFDSLCQYLNFNIYEKIYLDHYQITEEKINSKYGFNFVFYSDNKNSQTTTTLSNNTTNYQINPIFNENLNVTGMYSFSREVKNKKQENRILESKIISIAINNLYDLNNFIKARHPAKPLSDQEIQELRNHGLEATPYSPFIFISPPSESVTALLFYRTNHSWYWTPTIPKEYNMTEIKNLNWSIISEGQPIKAIGGRWDGAAPAHRNVILIEWLISTKLQYLQ